METERLYQPLTLMLKLTDFCPNDCLEGKYCFSRCRPNSRTWIDQNRIEDIFKQAYSEGIREVCYVSAEPFSDSDLLYDVTRKAVTSGITPRFLVTNGRIGKSYENALSCFSILRDAGFSTKIDENYIGTGYNGVDVSVDQFHGVPSMHLTNTILAALEVFGPTIFVNIRNTYPSLKYLDHTTLNEVVELLMRSEKFTFLHKPSREVIFLDGSRVKVTSLPINKFGNASTLPDDFFNWHSFNLHDLEEYKDLRESIRVDSKRSVAFMLPLHKLYLDPNGDCYPELGRFKVFCGGNAYSQSLGEIIDNIDNNPLIPLIGSFGFRGILMSFQDFFRIEPNLYATGDLHLHDMYLSQTQLIQRLKVFVRESGLEEQLRDILVPAVEQLRMDCKCKSLGTISNEEDPKNN